MYTQTAVAETNNNKNQCVVDVNCVVKIVEKARYMFSTYCARPSKGKMKLNIATAAEVV